MLHASERHEKGLARGERPPLIAARQIRKTFLDVVANDDVSFDVHAGEIHALLGENGSGKTTLCKVLTGLYRPDGGALWVESEQVAFRSPREAYAAGVFMVQQHFSLVERFTVAQNVVLGVPLKRRMIASQRGYREETLRAAARYGIDTDPDRPVWQLSVGERQRVEILKALYRGARLLILDEPTTVLTPQECERLFSELRALRDAGTAIVFIAHKLAEVMAVADRVTVLRNGRSVATLATSDATEEQLAELMVGRSIVVTQRQPRDALDEAPPLLHVRSISVLNDFGRPGVDKLSLSVRHGEILGIAGVAGNGQVELAEGICGVRRRRAGEVEVDGRLLKSGQPKDAMDAGLAYIPEDRFRTGLVPDLTVSDNLILKRHGQRPYSRWSVINSGAVHDLADRCISSFNIRGQSFTLARQLSGGNAQKVVLARELHVRPKVLIVASPTRGLDVGATAAVRSQLIQAAREGTAVVLISEDLDEVLELSDRVAVMFRGAIIGMAVPGQTERTTIGLLMAGKTDQGCAEEGASGLMAPVDDAWNAP